MSIFRYPGGKQKLKSYILPHLNNNHERYCEPFFGGGSIGTLLLNVDHLSHFRFNDKDIALWALWTAIFFHTEDLLELIVNFTPSIDAFYEYKNYLMNITYDIAKNNIVEVGFMKLVLHQTSYSGLGEKSGGPLGGKEQLSKYKVDCRWSVKSLTNKIINLKEASSNKNIEITCDDFETVIESLVSPSIIYLDPPYFVKGNELYKHGFTLEDHIRLATILQKQHNKWVLSYDDVPEIRELYSGWANIEEISVNCTINTKNVTSARKKGELVIFNG